MQNPSLKIRIPVLEALVINGALAADELGADPGGQDDGAADMALIQPHGDSHLLQVHADKGAADVQARVEANIKQLRDLNAKRKANKAAAATGELPEALDQFTVGSDYPVFIYRKDGIDAGGMRNFWDIVRSRLPEAGACVLASDNQGTPILLAAGTDAAVEKLSLIHI